MKTLHPEEHQPASASLCIPCVYFSKNLDRTEYSIRPELPDHCALGFCAGDEDCREMRTENCSVRKTT